MVIAGVVDAVAQPIHALARPLPNSRPANTVHLPAACYLIRCVPSQ